ncbi:uncharacterized protein C3orf22 homolog [Tupaia chinensis]|nr:uncharacterized protein C3orf22 homolog [Tupaia chinensis]
MDSKAHKACEQHKCRVRAQETFAKKCPYRFSWLTEPTLESPQPWAAMTNSAKEQLPLQKRLVPTRSIPVRGLGAPDFTAPLGYLAPPPPQCHLWELKLLIHRFPRLGARELSLPRTCIEADPDPWACAVAGPARDPS